MNPRHVYALASVERLQTALDALRGLGLADEQLSVVARHDIELQVHPDTPDPDAHGRVRGLLAGLSAVTVPTLGVSVAGAGLLTMLGTQAASWVPAIAGDSATDDVRAAFEERIDNGEVLLVVDAPPEVQIAAAEQLTVRGATRLPFDSDGDGVPD